MSPESQGSPDPAALRDASTIAERIARDEAAADAARDTYRHEGLPTLEAGADVASLLEPNEQLHAVHQMAMLERGSPGAVDPPLPRGGVLLLTSRRLIHRGEALAQWPLTDLLELSVSLERLLLVRLEGGDDLAIEVDSPRLLRVQLAAAMAAQRARAVAERIGA
jgi:hypothetical protein